MVINRAVIFVISIYLLQFVSCAVVHSGEVLLEGDDAFAVLPSVRRIVAIGDLHGDFNAARSALMMAGAIDMNLAWIGNDLVVVQVGDQLDRGDDERAIIDLFERLSQEARKTGGAVFSLNGNHEFMNAMSDFRYATELGSAKFMDIYTQEHPRLDLNQYAKSFVMYQL